MNSEKMKEIKEALECCKQNEIEETCGYCLVCPASNWDYEKTCTIDLFQKALTLINELESENERLIDQRNKTYNIWVKDTEKLKDRIAELERENDELKVDLKNSIDMQKQMLDNFKTATKEVEENLAREIPNLLKRFT